MGVRQFKPTSPGRRFMTISDFDEVTTDKPEKSLLAPVKRHGGRNNTGRITTRHQGGGHKRRYRIIDFKRRKDGVPATVASIEYDPNRSARIALLHYVDGHKAYILAPARLGVGSTVQSGADADIKVGNCLPLSAIPTGTIVHAVELRPGQGARMVRSAGGERPAGRTRGGARAAAPALRRAPPRPRDLPRDDRHRLERDASEPIERQGRPLALAGQAPVGARHGHEPGRPPAWWRRGQEQGQSPGHAVGQDHARAADP